MIHTVEGFIIVNEAEVDVFLKFSCFFYDPKYVGNLIYGSSAFPHKEQCCLGTYNVRSMNKGKLEVVKQEIAGVNISILEISKPKWTGMSEFNSDDHYIYYCGQKSIRRNAVTLIVNKRVQNVVFYFSSFPRQTIQCHSNPSLCPDH